MRAVFRMRHGSVVSWQVSLLYFKTLPGGLLTPPAHGFDIELTGRSSDNINIPVIASGGSGNPDHILEVLQDTNASAALAASIFHFGEYTVADVNEYPQKGGACPVWCGE